MKIEIPDKILDYVRDYDGTNLNVGFNYTTTNCGYGHLFSVSYDLSRLTKTCYRCGYDPLWRPELWESKCQRHRYNSERYDTVFFWQEGYDKQLEDCFDEWLAMQEKNKGMKKMIYRKVLK